ncbi:S-layer homology domain-containing protein [Bacillus sp. TH22]|uniref:S-layer homology domain-containing protein n=1 Tax=unclassified Bacillus (in: firmicutes) TaxID=185979 RepID=UPI0019113302|nr:MULTISPECIES: S-layer homology domain-containing protein [unclassified Bacillus (in: firmicutes)]MBK5359853.1 S-layer homology domain-containing protein [Bacillus sp. TH44]MBK5349951.1 S-layer homology domain-containing protein [Bacillus sp. TH45]MBK5363139.1 S-layer homology domain-containing protein [Bacillus sp. TH50]MBK5451734.1 S-layer homology domain-containing protein [Bacillus sp. TH22]MBK5454529.1 S-layer homology domain-containing protein [Bacillus sp. TH23]
MKKEFYNVLAASIVFSMVTIPSFSYADTVEKTVTISTDEQALKSIESHMKDEDGRGESKGITNEVQGDFFVHIIGSASLFDSAELQKATGVQLSNQVVKAEKQKGNAYYVQTESGAGWIQSSEGNVEVKEVYHLANEKLVINEETATYSAPFNSYKDEKVLQPQTIIAIGQVGEWFQVQIDNEVKWIYAPSAKFEGTKASLIQSTTPTRTKREAVMYAAPSAEKTTDIYGVPLKEMIVPTGNENIRPGYAMKPKYITIHETDNYSVGANARNHAQYLYSQATGTTDRSASWHFTVDDKEIYQHLPLNENAWHAGDGAEGTGNRESIAIEIAVNQDGDYNKAVENARKLAAYLMGELNIPLENVKKHQFWSGKNCPAIMIRNNAWEPFLQGTKAYYDANHKDDITGGWYEADIRELDKRGIMVGDGKGSYWPERLVTRGEFANLVSRSLQLPEGKSNFKDLSTAHPSLVDGINRAASAGIISGRGNDIFAPNDTIKRDEAVIMIDRALQYKNIKGNLVSLPFTDQNLAYDKQAVQRVYGLGIVKGNENNEFMPKGSATRGESAAFINRMLKVIESK